MATRLDMSGFRDQMTTDRLRNHFNTEMHAEAVNFIPCKDGQPRRIVVHIEEGDDYELDNVNTEDLVETIEVRCFTDETLRDEDGTFVGGIHNPSIGDRIERDSEYDPDDRPFMFEGEIKNKGFNTHRLMFVRRARVGQGVEG